MALFDWNEKYSVGIRAFDDDHKRLLLLINALFEAMREQKGNQVIGAVLDELTLYTSTHFGLEERMMRHHRYPELDAHIAEHAVFTGQVAGLQHRFHTGTGALSIETLGLLRSWLVNHIQVTDKRYTRFFRVNGVR